MENQLCVGLKSRSGYNKPIDCKLITWVSYKNKKVPPRVEFKKLIKKMVDQVKYKEPKIVRAERGWFIALYYEYPDHLRKFKRFEISAGIN